MFDPVLKTLTYGEFLDAMEKNGVEQTIGAFFGRGKFQTIYSDDLILDDELKISRACAIGQGMINSGICRILETEEPVFLSAIIALNDTKGLPIGEIVSRMREGYRDSLDFKMVGIAFDFTGRVEWLDAPAD